MPPPVLPDISEAVRSRLGELVLADGRPVVAIATAAGLNRQVVYQLLNGYRKNSSIRTIGELPRALGRPWAALDGSDQPSIVS